MFLGLNNENRYQIVVDVVDDTIVSNRLVWNILLGSS